MHISANVSLRLLRYATAMPSQPLGDQHAAGLPKATNTDRCLRGREAAPRARHRCVRLALLDGFTKPLMLIIGQVHLPEVAFVAGRLRSTDVRGWLL